MVIAGAEPGCWLGHALIASIGSLVLVDALGYIWVSVKGAGSESAAVCFVVVGETRDKIPPVDGCADGGGDWEKANHEEGGL